MSKEKVKALDPKEVQPLKDNTFQQESTLIEIGKIEADFKELKQRKEYLLEHLETLESERASTIQKLTEKYGKGYISTQDNTFTPVEE